MNVLPSMFTYASERSITFSDGVRHSVRSVISKRFLTDSDETVFLVCGRTINLLVANVDGAGPYVPLSDDPPTCLACAAGIETWGLYDAI